MKEQNGVCQFSQVCIYIQGAKGPAGPLPLYPSILQPRHITTKSEKITRPQIGPTAL